MPRRRIAVSEEHRGPLHGVLIAIRTSALSRACRPLPASRCSGQVAERTSTVAAWLKAAGAVIPGKLQLTEGALALHHRIFRHR
jgi:amidase